jgi:transketolase
MRTAFIEQLIIEAERDKKVFLLVGDLGFSVVEPFRDKFPDRFLNVGVAEQNMTGIAAGLAMNGYTVFTYSIANFPTLRCLEQIRNDICYHDLNVKIVSVGGGYAYASLGASHHATEDIGIMRVIPNLLICSPGDPMEAKAITRELVTYKGPAYLRLGKAGEPIVHLENQKMEFGKQIKVITGMDCAVLSTGGILKYAHDYILNNKLKYSLYSFPYIKPFDLMGIAEICKNYKEIITIEEHQISGGFGSAVLEAMHDLHQQKLINFIPAIKRIAIPDSFITVAGSQEHLRKLAGINLDNVR